MPQPPANTKTFDALLDLVGKLRGPEGCPWDKEQTHSSLSKYCIEEANELATAIDRGNDKEMLDELGDVLFQVVLHSEVAKQRGAFTIDDVIENLNEKMIRRHPHVFSDTKVGSSQEVVANWEQIKAKEKANKKAEDRFDIPDSLTGTLKAYKIGKKTHKINFDWTDAHHVFEKVKEEFHELEEALSSDSKEHQEHELGDMIFTLVQLARHLELDPEAALRKTNLRFEKRFFNMLKLAGKSMEDLKGLSPEQLEEIWQNSKKNLAQ